MVRSTFFLVLVLILYAEGIDVILSDGYTSDYFQVIQVIQKTDRTYEMINHSNEPFILEQQSRSKVCHVSWPYYQL